jgi:hypothetical protein
MRRSVGDRSASKAAVNCNLINGQGLGNDDAVRLCPSPDLDGQLAAGQTGQVSEVKN